MAERVPSVLEAEAKGEIADIYADIRKVLGTSVVNLIWRNLATMPGALEWTWSTVRTHDGALRVDPAGDAGVNAGPGYDINSTLPSPSR